MEFKAEDDEPKAEIEVKKSSQQIFRNCLIVELNVSFINLGIPEYGRTGEESFTSLFLTLEHKIYNLTIQL